MAIANVLVNLSLDRGFDYLIPDNLADKIAVGAQVTVPFNRGERTGFVMNISDTSEVPPDKLKSVLSIPANRTRIPEKLIELGNWMAEYYCAGREQAVRSLLPSAVRQGKVREKTMKLFALAPEPPKDAAVKTARQQSVLAVLRREKELPLKALTVLADCGESVVRNLEKRGFLTSRDAACYREIFADEVLPSTPLEPTAEQRVALEKFDAMGKTEPDVMLLFGVTNSGKTEVYLQAIAKVLAAGRSAVVLVPEIALTPQTVRRFRARFGEKVSVLHSRLSEGERFDQWNRISRGEVSIAVGARSALFAPFTNLGLIIVDEEHESSYKQSEAPRYHARDVAVMRGKLENAKVILGSATPSFESYRNAVQKKYLLVRMTAAASGVNPPEITVVDLKMAAAPDGESGEVKSPLFSPMLVNAVRERLTAAEQVILFLNRRGFARQMMCEDCGYVAGCPECSVSTGRPAAFTYHKREGLLACHMCGMTMPAPERCPECGSESVRFSGSGTEKLEAIAKLLFPHARIARMDADTTRGADSHEQILDRLQRREIDILIGTQMIAKGLHFPNITLVGVINADQTLYLPDFRAAERTFGLITQVAGRAGRGTAAGEVIVQTFSPLNETITLAKNCDYEGFYKYDCDVRELLKYPPFGHAILVHFRDPDQTKCAECAKAVFDELKSCLNDSIIAVEPLPAPIERIKGLYRYQIMFRGEKLKRLRTKLRLIAMRKNPVEIFVDADPQSLL